ncbi:hypothetical protein BDZ85DRAFT_258152 [Elsinoe ampelina]|uniref:BTB domain-containing protein n=1 Tax=Elsinoe ampelina TaxID=302913 RepID=A0A6A6GJK1_9PEZI|nr:hypothetical protein BDZ85DRAFT_258152 [Elsinoe ampelina]
MVLLLCGHPHQAQWVHRHVLVKASAALERRLADMAPFSTLELRCAYTRFEVGAFIEWVYSGSIDETMSMFGPTEDNIVGNTERVCGLMHLHRFASDVECEELIKVVEVMLSEAGPLTGAAKMDDPTVIDFGDALMVVPKAQRDKWPGSGLKRGFDNYSAEEH